MRFLVALVISSQVKKKGGVQRSGGSGIREADSDDLSEAKGSLSRFPATIK